MAQDSYERQAVMNRVTIFVSTKCGELLGHVSYYNIINKAYGLRGQKFIRPA
jgi:hypothetical protein